MRVGLAMLESPLEYELDSQSVGCVTAPVLEAASTFFSSSPHPEIF